MTTDRRGFLVVFEVKDLAEDGLDLRPVSELPLTQHYAGLRLRWRTNAADVGKW